MSGCDEAFLLNSDSGSFSGEAGGDGGGRGGETLAECLHIREGGEGFPNLAGQCSGEHWSV